MDPVQPDDDEGRFLYGIEQIDGSFQVVETADGASSRAIFEHESDATHFARWCNNVNIQRDDGHSMAGAIIGRFNTYERLILGLAEVPESCIVWEQGNYQICSMCDGGARVGEEFRHTTECVWHAARMLVYG